MSRICSSSTYEETLNLRSLEEALARAITRPRKARRLGVYENDFAASSFLMKLLLRATPLRPPVDRARAAQLLRDAQTRISVESLEQRFWIRFPLGWLHLPQAVRMKLSRVL
jgi:hypothetical protein